MRFGFARQGKLSSPDFEFSALTFYIFSVANNII